MDRPADDAVLLDLARTVVGSSPRAAADLGGVSVTQLRALLDAVPDRSSALDAVGRLVGSRPAVEPAR